MGDVNANLDPLPKSTMRLDKATAIEENQQLKKTIDEQAANVADVAANMAELMGTFKKAFFCQMVTL